MAKPEISLNPNPLCSRYGYRIDKPLEALWRNRFGKIYEFITQNKDGGFMDQVYLEYIYKDLEILFALEQLRKLGLIPETSLTNYLTLFKTENNPGILDGLTIGVIGGPEGEIFAALGAEAVSIDPYLDKLPPHNRPNLTEIPKPLNDSLAKTFADKFDLTFSSWLFDQGSGLDSTSIPLIGYTSPHEISVYAYYLNLIMSMTKPGGISVHNGNMVHLAIKSMDDPNFRVLEASAHFSGSRLGMSDVCIALQRIS